MVDTDNAKSKREFKKLSKCMGDKLDKEKGQLVVERRLDSLTLDPYPFFFLGASKSSRRPTLNETTPPT